MSAGAVEALVRLMVVEQAATGAAGVPPSLTQPRVGSFSHYHSNLAMASHAAVDALGGMTFGSVAARVASVNAGVLSPICYMLRGGAHTAPALQAEAGERAAGPLTTSRSVRACAAHVITDLLVTGDDGISPHMCQLVAEKLFREGAVALLCDMLDSPGHDARRYAANALGNLTRYDFGREGNVKAAIVAAGGHAKLLKLAVTPLTAAVCEPQLLALVVLRNLAGVIRGSDAEMAVTASFHRVFITRANVAALMSLVDAAGSIAHEEAVAALTNLMAFADADAFTVAQQMAASPECLQALVKSLARLAPPGPLAAFSCRAFPQVAACFKVMTVLKSRAVCDALVAAGAVDAIAAFLAKRGGAATPSARQNAALALRFLGGAPHEAQVRASSWWGMHYNALFNECSL